MEARKNPSQHMAEKLRAAALVLRQKVQEVEGLTAEEKARLKVWAARLLETSFGQHLLLNKQLDGTWVSFVHEGSNSSWFNELPSLASLRLRHDVATSVIDRHLCAGMDVAVVPSSYMREWDQVVEGGGNLEALNTPEELLARENTVDLMIKGGFLYGDPGCNEDLVSYLYAALKPGGVLIISEWVAPTDADGEDPLEDLLFARLLGMEKCTYKVPSAIKTLLRCAGFEQIQTLSEEGDRLRTCTAVKPDGGTISLKSKRSVAHTPRRMTRKGILFKDIAPALS